MFICITTELGREVERGIELTMMVLWTCWTNQMDAVDAYSGSVPPIDR